MRINKMGFEDDALDSDAEHEKKVSEILEERKKEVAAEEQAKEKAREENREKFTAESQERKKLNDLVEAMGIKTISEDVDNLKASVKALAEKLGESIEAINKINDVFNANVAQSGGPIPGTAAPGTAAAPFDAEKLEVMGNLIEKIYGMFRPQAAAGPQPLIDQNMINEKMKSAFLDDLETGENIRRFISDTLKRKATRTVVTQALGDMGEQPPPGRQVNHGPT
jgi:hypothetical protein